MLIFRYLAKEVFITLVALTAILLLIFMSNQLIGYLNRAANGQIPGVFILKLMMFELPTLMSLLLPLGFYVALLLALGRLYADSEMIVLQACGYGPLQLLTHALMMALAVASFVLMMMVWLSPIIAMDRAKLLQTTGVQTLIKTILPGHFRALSGGKQVFYVESISRDHQSAKNIFFAQFSEKEAKSTWDVLWADRALVEANQATHEEFVVLEQGKKYQGKPGEANYQVAEFAKLKVRLPHPNNEVKHDIRVVNTANLWPLNNSDLAKAAELQWRLSIPMMVISLTLVAVPLSRVNPRSGKFAKLLPAIVIFIIYANLMFIARDWLSSGKIPIWLGLWWLHLSVALLGGWLIWRQRS